MVVDTDYATGICLRNWIKIKATEIEYEVYNEEVLKQLQTLEYKSQEIEKIKGSIPYQKSEIAETMVLVVLFIFENKNSEIKFYSLPLKKSCNEINETFCPDGVAFQKVISRTYPQVVCQRAKTVLTWSSLALLIE